MRVWQSIDGALESVVHPLHPTGERWVAARGSDGAFWLREQSQSGVWGTWECLGGSFVGKPALCPVHGVLVLGVTDTGELRAWTRRRGWSSAPEVSAGNGSRPRPKAPGLAPEIAVCLDEYQTLHVFVPTTNRTLVHATLAASVQRLTWSQWTDLGAPAPVAARAARSPVASLRPVATRLLSGDVAVFTMGREQLSAKPGVLCRILAASGWTPWRQVGRPRKLSAGLVLVDTPRGCVVAGREDQTLWLLEEWRAWGWTRVHGAEFWEELDSNLPALGVLESRVTAWVTAKDLAGHRVWFADQEPSSGQWSSWQELASVTQALDVDATASPAGEFTLHTPSLAKLPQGPRLYVGASDGALRYFDFERPNLAGPAPALRSLGVPPYWSPQETAIESVAVRPRASGRTRRLIVHLARTGSSVEPSYQNGFLTRTRGVGAPASSPEWTPWRLVAPPGREPTKPLLPGDWVAEDPATGRLTFFLWQDVAQQVNELRPYRGSIQWTLTQSDVATERWGSWMASEPLPISDQGRHFVRLTPLSLSLSADRLVFRIVHNQGHVYQSRREGSGWSRFLTLANPNEPTPGAPITSAPVAVGSSFVVSAGEETFRAALEWELLGSMRGARPAVIRDSGNDVEFVWYERPGVKHARGWPSPTEQDILLPAPTTAGTSASWWLAKSHPSPIVTVDPEGRAGMLVLSHDGQCFFARQAVARGNFSPWVALPLIHRIRDVALCADVDGFDVYAATDRCVYQLRV